MSSLLTKLKRGKEPVKYKPVMVSIPIKKINIQFDREEFIKNYNNRFTVKIKERTLRKDIKKVGVTVLPTNKDKKPNIRFEKNIKKGSITDYDEVNPLEERTINKININKLKINGKNIKDRLPPKFDEVRIEAPGYYLNNRIIFLKFLNNKKIFGKYKQMAKDDKTSVSCDDFAGKKTFQLLTHQKLVKDYMNVNTPYRGLLLFHGLGAGKTCSSIAIAEGLKSTKRVIILTPASLRLNYIKELKKCGDPLYRLNQHWEFIETNENDKMEKGLSKILSLSLQYIKKKGGAWLVNSKKESNYGSLNMKDKKSLDDQLHAMIRKKYRFINFDGLRKDKFNALERESLELNGRRNIFDNKIVIVDEVHNFISRISNKLRLGKTLPKNDMNVTMYKYLKDAENCKIIFLTGTPIINYPNELGILYNMLRGYIKSYEFKIDNSNWVGKGDFTLQTIKNFFKKDGLIDYINYKQDRTTQTIIITRNPYGFKSIKDRKGRYGGVTSVNAHLDESEFKKYVKDTLLKHNIKIVNKFTLNKYNALPETFNDFYEKFIVEDIYGTKKVKNPILFQRRILGLTSYFRSAQEKLLPKLLKPKMVLCEMSNYQLGIYQDARKSERKRGKPPSNVKDMYKNENSSYRMGSRSSCNFVFPEEIKKPKKKGKITEEGENAELDDKEYAKEIKKTLRLLKENGDKYLTGKALKEYYSPKFYQITKRLQPGDNFKGIHLVYSNFKSLEGIGILGLVLETINWKEFKIEKVNSQWSINMTDEEIVKHPCYAKFTGDEDNEKKDIIRKILNSEWNAPELDKIRTRLTNIGFENNFYGDVIKVFMVTKAGAEGIDLKNVRYVHITEPYWHPVRKKQVIGRARRICSHHNLPEKYRTVQVFEYLTVFSDKQINGDPDAENEVDRKPLITDTTKLKDKSKFPNEDGEFPVVTTDESLHETSNAKEEINNEILILMKNTSIDCEVYKDGRTEKLSCFKFSSKNPDFFLSKPVDWNDNEEIDKSFIKQFEVQKGGSHNNDNYITISGKRYVLRNDSDDLKQIGGTLYDYNAYNNGLLLNEGSLNKKGNKLFLTY